MARSDRPRVESSLLFDEDFDAIVTTETVETTANPEASPAVFTEADVEEARRCGFADGRSAAQAESALSQHQDLRTLLSTITTSLQDVDSRVLDEAEQHADEIARLLLDVLATFLPTLCERHGEAEVRAIARAILPALCREPVVNVRVNPTVAAAIKEEIGRLEPEFVERIHIVETPSTFTGDIRVSWRDGTAVRSVRDVWNEIAQILAQSGLAVDFQFPELESNA